MSLTFEHVHIVCEDPHASARWYQDILGATIAGEHEVRGAAQIRIEVGGVLVFLRGRRPGEAPVSTRPMREYEGYSSHNEWGTDHFGFTYNGNLRAYCEELRSKGAEFSVEPWEFAPGTLLCYLAAPDGVSIELVQAK